MRSIGFAWEILDDEVLCTFSGVCFSFCDFVQLRWRRYKVSACSVGVASTCRLCFRCWRALPRLYRWTTNGPGRLQQTGAILGIESRTRPNLAETVRFDNASTANLNTIVNACAPGDLNCDGTVDAGDYVTWRKANGSAADYTAIRANFGTTPGIGFPISGIANTSVSVSGVNVGPNIGGAATNVTITGFPLRIGSTGIRNGSGAPADPLGYTGPAQVNVTVDTDIYMTAEQSWKSGGPGGSGGVGGVGEQSVFVGASPNGHTAFLNGSRLNLEYISNADDKLVVNTKLVDGSAASPVHITKVSTAVGVNSNAVGRLRISGDNTYSGGTTILGGHKSSNSAAAASRADRTSFPAHSGPERSR